MDPEVRGVENFENRSGEEISCEQPGDTSLRKSECFRHAFEERFVASFG